MDQIKACQVDTKKLILIFRRQYESYKQKCTLPFSLAYLERLLFLPYFKKHTQIFLFTIQKRSCDRNAIIYNLKETKENSEKYLVQ